MKHIIIDTNVVHLDYTLSKPRITALCSTCASLDHIVFIPDVVVDELVKQYKEEVCAYAEQFNKVLNQMNRRGVSVPATPLDKQALTSKYETTLRAKIASLGIRIIGYPKTAHKDIVARELCKRKPFKDSSKGYRDSLIWESIKEHCKSINKSIEVIFLSENSDDFAGKDKLTFHQDLLEDIDAIGIDRNRIRLVTGVQSFIDNEILGKSKELQELLAELQSTKGIGDIDILEEVNNFVNDDLISNYITEDYFGDGMTYIPGYYENPELTALDVTSISFDSIREISGSHILIKCIVEIETEMDVYIYHGDLAMIDDQSQPYIFDYDWNEHYAAASDSATFRIGLNIICDKELTEVQSIDDEVLQVDYQTGYHFEV